MSRKLKFKAFGLLAAGFGLVAAFLVPLFAADTTISKFDVANQVSRSVRLKDNTDGSFSMAHWNTGDGTHFMPSGDAPARAVSVIQSVPGTFVVGTSTVAAQANSPTLPAVAAKTNYVSGFTVTGGGATAASAITITLSDGTNTLNFMTEIPAGAGLQTQPLIVGFPKPLPATAGITAWTLTVPSFGAGNTAASANIFGYVK